MEILKNHSFYKVSLQSVRGEEISQLLKRAKLAAEAADRLTVELGADSRTESPNALCPGVGIGSLIFSRPQGSKKYTCIGFHGKKHEYIPNMTEDKGKAIAQLIYKLPTINTAEYRSAFGIQNDVKVSPAWFISGDAVYLKCCYGLGEEFVGIEEEEYEEEKAKMGKEDVR